MTKMLITGANGYIGTHVAEYIQEICPEVELICTDFASNNLPKNINFVDYDILKNCQNENLYHDLGQPDTVIHLVWQDGFNHNAESHIENFCAHYKFLKNLAEKGCKNISIMGTMHEIGYYEGCVDENTPCNPLSHYGIAKNALRQLMLVYANKQDICLKWLRAYYILGDDKQNKSLFGKICKMAENGQKTFPFTDGLNQYDFIEIKELAAQIARASIQKEIDGIINVCSGSPVALKDKVEEFIVEQNLEICPEYGVYPNRPYDSPAIWGDASKIKQILEKSA